MINAWMEIGRAKDFGDGAFDEHDFVVGFGDEMFIVQGYYELIKAIDDGVDRFFCLEICEL